MFWKRPGNSLYIRKNIKRRNWRYRSIYTFYTLRIVSSKYLLLSK